MSFREIAVTIRAVNHASAEFSRIQTDAEALSVKIRNIGNALMGLGASAVVIGNIAHQFGLLNDEQTRVVNTFGSIVTAIGGFIRVLNVLRDSSIAVAVAEHARAAAHALAMAFSGPAGWAILAGAAIAAGAAMAYLATQTQGAAAAQRDYNAAVKEMPDSSRNIRRSGDDLLRRGIED